MTTKILKAAAVACALVILTACTPRRSDSAPEPSGDTVEVVIPE